MCLCVYSIVLIIWLHSKPGFPFHATNAVFGPGSGLIFLDNVNCSGTEPSLLECRSQDPGVHNCARSEDAGVYCPGEEGEWEEGKEGEGGRGREEERKR